MATVRDIITRTYKRLRVIAEGETPSASAMSDGLDALNDMIYSWATDGVDVLSQGFALNDTFVFWVPPKVIDEAQNTSTVADSCTYAGTWNASTNTPTLTGGNGTSGTVYKVSVAGSTALDALTSYAVGDFIVFNGTRWLKGLSSNRHTQSVVALLAVRMARDFGTDVPDTVFVDANDGWARILADYIKVPDASYDKALTRLPSRRWPYSVPASEAT